MTTHTHAFFEALNCPTRITWTGQVQQMFTQLDVDHMKLVTKGALDLSSYTSVKTWAHKIYNEVSTGAMPPPGSGEPPWPQQRINDFGCWIQQGCPQS